MIIRTGKQTDDNAIYDLVKDAFSTMDHASGDEQNLVGRLRKSAGYVPELELVAELDGQIAGHLMLTEIPVKNTKQLILAPLAVAPDKQKQGIGGALIKRAHEIAKKGGLSACAFGRPPGILPAFRLPSGKRFRTDVRAGNPAGMFYGGGFDGRL